MAMNLHNELRPLYAQDGWLSRAEPHFRPARGQTAMAMAVRRRSKWAACWWWRRAPAWAETFSYLVPSLLSGKRVVMSTATKALQDQLYLRDLPRLVQALGLPLRLARLKGRSSYLCLHRLGQVHQSKVALDPQVLRAVARVQDWSHGTRTGNLGELPGLAESSTVAALVTSTKAIAWAAAAHIGSNATSIRPVRRRWRRDISWSTTTCSLRIWRCADSGVAQLLPTAGVVVIDEAHQLNETGIQFAGWVLGTRQLQGFIKDALADVTLHARGLADWMQLLGQLEQAINEWRCGGRRQPARHALALAGGCA